jgi:cytochrome b pre-mRNA-processing protein 3
MSNKYINVYNNLINLTRNKELYKDFTEQDAFSDRLIFFLLHFAFFLKVFKKDNNKKILQEIYDHTFRELELSIREIGYGDQSINKRMKNYLNIFYDIINKIDCWEDLEDSNKSLILSNFLNSSVNISFLIKYFENYMRILLNNTLNSYIKGVIKH